MIKEIFDNTKTIAIVGLSDKPMRPSHEVASYLQHFFTIYPVNPNVSEVLGVKSYPDLDAIPDHIDMVDVFQRSTNVMRFVQPAIDCGVTCFWMQLGIANQDARLQLEAVGITVIEDLCTKIEHARLMSQ